MRFLSALTVCSILAIAAQAQSSQSVTVPVTLDHNRVIIDVYLPLADGTSKRVRAWVRSGSSELVMSHRIGALFGAVACEKDTCNATPPHDMLIGGMKIPLSGIESAHTPAGFPDDVMVPGMGAEITLPSVILRNYDVVFDYANRQFTIAEPGAVKFQGTSNKANINSLGMIQFAVKVESQFYGLRLDTGSGVTLVSAEVMSQWHSAHPAWPWMKGSVGIANTMGVLNEAGRETLRLPAMQLSGSTLGNVLIASLPTEEVSRLKQPLSPDVRGLLGGDALRNYRVGLDYAHQLVYLEQLSHSTIGIAGVPITLLARADGRYTVIAVIDGDGKTAVPDLKVGDVLLGVDGAPASGATLGQVWSLLGGTPGQSRALTLERDGKIFTVNAPVRKFLAAATATPVKSPRRNPHRRN